ncbi:hypothetical protein RBWH47_00598 [Rhodopirellula baltica WH47]|uniref:Uncharacterized protein n=1 Tax=Rhodopirellula baltica WH47 TaxID=991778 RepID=F2AXC3_RHOBT|nr:hypothetical protein RBWH47_00598 [Rhodopirellula baltica WH47]
MATVPSETTVANANRLKGLWDDGRRATSLNHRWLKRHSFRKPRGVMPVVL